MHVHDPYRTQSVNVLLVEDDAEIISDLKDACGEVAQLTVLTDRTTALSAVQASDADFDLVICDLLMPALGTSEAAVDHGMAVALAVRAVAPGTPLIVFTGHADPPILQKLIREAKQGDPFGVGREEPLLEYLTKDQLDECVGKVKTFATQAAAVRAVDVDDIGLQPKQERVIRVFARARGASVARLKRLGGGYTDAVTVRVLAQDPNGVTVARVVAKISRLARMDEERIRYEQHVANVLPAGRHTHLVNVVRAGAWGTGALIYRLADGFDATLFELLGEDTAKAALAVPKIRETLATWRTGAPAEQRLAGELRRCTLSDRQLNECATELAGSDFRGAEAKTLQSVWCVQHGDLHAGNVLVNEAGEPTIIDFGSVGAGPASLDPLTLELSVLFHRDGASLRTTWPTAEQLAHWYELEVYLENCPYPDFVKACRLWLDETAGSPREIAATLYGYAARQLRFPDTNHEWARALCALAIRHLLR
jgi:CheY-like chemotaxis protein